MTNVPPPMKKPTCYCHVDSESDCDSDWHPLEVPEEKRAAAMAAYELLIHSDDEDDGVVWPKVQAGAEILSRLRADASPGNPYWTRHTTLLRASNEMIRFLYEDLNLTDEEISLLRIELARERDEAIRESEEFEAANPGAMYLEGLLKQLKAYGVGRLDKLSASALFALANCSVEEIADALGYSRDAAAHTQKNYILPLAQNKASRPAK